MVLNEQRQVRVAIAPIEKFLARVLRRLRLRSGAISVNFVTAARIARWNGSYRGKNKPTDVLSFPTGAQPHARRARGARARSTRLLRRWGSDGSDYLGDIAISPLVAKQNARRFDRSFEDELRILVLHGVLHLMGYDHETDRGEMERVERRLRRELRLG